MTWSENYYDTIAKRMQLWRRIEQDSSLIRRANEHYAKHPADFINQCCITVDPRIQKVKSVPFVLFDKQKEFARYWQELISTAENGLTEKCRDMGVTWECAALAVHGWRYIKDFSCGFGSSKEIKVDKIGDLDSIFEKIRRIIKNLPWWALPDDFNPRTDLSYMKIMNRTNGAIIKGEAGDNIGRGGRSTIYVKDESAHYERPEKIEAALSMNTDVQLDVSSVNGAGNVFYRRRQAGQLWTPEVVMPRGVTRVFIFDWRDDPRKDLEWYEAKRQKYESEGMQHIFAQEVDRDYFAATERIIINQDWVKAAIDADKALGFETAMREGEKVGAQDVADGGGDRNALAGRSGVVLDYLDQWSGEAQEAAKKAVPLAIERGWQDLFYDCIGVGVGFRVQAKIMTVPKWLRILPWDASGAVLDPTKPIVTGDQKSPKNEDHFLNLKAQGWWRLRTRFYKTYRAVRFGEKYHPSELISLSSDLKYLHQLCMELSQPTYEYNQAGKMLVDKKPDGTVSPNLADAVMMCFNPVRPPLGVFNIL